jgi:diaminohydroxyphosphoribosylaminopyrimidine deaminase/5-amino-6-(5-phosphoribosylamino)uracil reductase
MVSQDEKWMARALELAEKGRGYVEPNPLVGAVVVQKGKIVGQGHHEHFGKAHAEINALTQAGESAQGATLYVSLEPCCHHGKTPPCTDVIIRNKIKRVVAAMKDPFSQVAGQGEKCLRSAGISVEMGLMEHLAKHLNAPYLKLLKTGRPYVHAKWAMTLDGKIATRTGDSKWISGELARRCTHQLRGRMDAVIVGIGTVLADNPRLTVRPPGPRIPARFVLDSRGRIPKDCRLVRTARKIPLLVVTGNLEGEKASHLKKWGCEVLELPGKAGRPDILHFLDEMGSRDMTNVLVEGGAEVLGAFFDARAVDEVHAFIAPRIAGGKQLTAVAGIGVAKIAEGLELIDLRIEQVGEDVLVHGFCQ